MDEEILKEIETFKFKILDLYAIVTDNSSEFSYYVMYENKIYHYNELFEQIADDELFELGNKIVNIIKEKQVLNKINFITYHNNEISIKYLDNNESIYKIKKEFKSKLNYL